MELGAILLNCNCNCNKENKITLIFSAGVPQLQHPVLTAGLVEGGEPLVRSVAEHPRSQEVGIAVSDPGHLIKTRKYVISTPASLVLFLTVKLPRFLMEQAILDVFPLMPMTVLPGPSTK